jgi:nicotinamidase-related amidase
MMKTGLLLIDFQNDYFPGGRMEVEGSLDASVHGRELLSYFRERNLPLVHIQHVSTRPGATFFLPDTTGIDIHDFVKPLPHETLIQKNYPNSFRNTALLDHLTKQGITRLAIGGMMTHMCVDATTRAAVDFGFECIVVNDACAARALNFGDVAIPASHVHGAFLAALAAVYAKVVTAKELVERVIGSETK